MTARGSLGIAAALIAGAFGGCQTVDLGSPPADVNACRPSHEYFGDVWDQVLTQDYGGKHCYDSQCHGGASSNSLHLMFPVPAMRDAQGVVTLPLTMESESNYRATTEQMNCSNVASSPLLTRPSGVQTHGGGMLFSPTGTEADLIKGWVGSALP